MKFRIIEDVVANSKSDFHKHFCFDNPLYPLYVVEEYKSVGILWWKRMDWVRVASFIHKQDAENFILEELGKHPRQLAMKEAKKFTPKVIKEYE